MKWSSTSPKLFFLPSSRSVGHSSTFLGSTLVRGSCGRIPELGLSEGSLTRSRNSSRQSLHVVCFIISMSVEVCIFPWIRHRHCLPSSVAKLCVSKSPSALSFMAQGACLSSFPLLRSMLGDECGGMSASLSKMSDFDVALVRAQTNASNGG